MKGEEVHNEIAEVKDSTTTTPPTFRHLTNQLLPRHSSFPSSASICLED